MASQSKPLFSFEPFARHQFYKDINKKLVDRIGLKPGDHVVDLACGTGAATRLILERVGTVKDLGEFLTTEQGERFLGSLAPPQFRPQLRTVSAIGTGIVFLVVGLFLMFALHTTVLGGSSSRTTPPALLMGVLLLVAIGIGMLVSAIVSFFVARRLGLDGSRRNGSRKDDAV